MSRFNLHAFHLFFLQLPRWTIFKILSSAEQRNSVR